MRRLLVGLVALIAFGALGGYAVGAVSRAKPGEVARGSLAATLVIRSGSQGAVDVSQSVAVASADFKLTVPNGHQDLFDVRFSGAVSFPNGQAFPVAIDVVVDGVAMDPSGLPAWQNATTSELPFQVERAIGPLAAGTYDVSIQLTGANRFNHGLVQLLGWTLVSQRTTEAATRATSDV
jgi:hypothetical protein